ncbi:MAG: SDR family oxidoreductase [Phycisphaerae bacterium]|nr:SDR family oxidoreductase [Phycisphaerae bacterium]
MSQPTGSKVALVTGAGSGIGRAIALALAREGFSLTLVGRRSDPLRETARLAAPATYEMAVVDLATADACRAAVEACVACFGRLDVLVNNAGIGVLRPIGQTSPELVEDSYRLNALAPAWTTLAAWPHFERQKAGCVVNISSMASFDPFPGFFAYAGSKAAVNLQAASIAKEGAAIGVRAFAVAPGAVETAMLRASFDLAALPAEQALDPSAVARVVLDCISGVHDRYNGRTIPVLPESAKAGYRGWIRDHPPITP